MKQFIRLLVCFLPILASAQQTDSAWIVNNYTKKELLIPMRDGVKLFTVIYSPKDPSEKHPVLLLRTGYSCKPYGESNFTPIWNTPRKYFFREKYIYVQQDVRGRWNSEGTFLNIRPFNPYKKNNETDEASDAYDTIDWLVKNVANNNNKVGVMGTSYPGFYAALAAYSQHPSLKAVSP